MADAAYERSDTTPRAWRISATAIPTVWLVLTLRRRIGTIASLAAAVFLAISPGAVYLSRYFIHETLLVFFTLGLVIAAIRFYETARTVYLMLAATACALMFATKETAFISAGVVLIAFASTAVLFKLRAANKKDERKAGGEDPPTRGRLHRATDLFGGALAIAI